MQALLGRSMIENRFTPNYSRNKPFSTILLRGSLILLLLFTVNFSATVAQEATAIQPCTEASAAAGKTKPAIEGPRVTQTVVDESIPDDPTIQKLIAPYSARVRELELVIGKLEGELRKGGVGGGSLGSFVTDALKSQASRKLGHSVPLMVTNSGGLRKNTIASGDLRAADIFELLPFENALITIDLTGEQVLQLLNVVLKGRDAQSGAHVRYRMISENNAELVSAKLISADGSELDIDPKRTYQIVTIDYLLHLSSGSYALLQEGKNVTNIGVTMRDAMMEYVKSETAAGRAIQPPQDNRFELVEQPPVKPEAKP